MLILAVNMKEALVSVRSFVVRNLVFMSGIHFFDDVLEYLKGEPMTRASSHVTILCISVITLVGQEFDQGFTKQRSFHGILVYKFDDLEWESILASILGKEFIHGTVLQQGHLESIFEYPEADEISPAQRFSVVEDELAGIQPGVKVSKNVFFDIEQFDLFLSCFHEVSVEGGAELIRVEDQQIFVDDEGFLEWINNGRDNSSLEVLSVVRLS